HHVLELDHAEHLLAGGDDQRRRTVTGDVVDRAAYFEREVAALRARPGLDRVGGTLADGAAVQVHAAHARLSGEGYERPTHRVHVALAQAMPFLGEYHDAAAFGRLVGQRGELRRVGQAFGSHARRRQKGGGLAVAERDGASLVEQQ